MKKIFFFFGAVALICSCSAPKATSYSYSEYKTISPSQSVYTVPLVADLNVASERITYAERVNQNITKLTDAEVEALASREKDGMHWEAGLMGNIKGFAISLGVSSITDFSNMYYEAKLGLGYCF